jgi:hypothetical protein
MGVDHRRLDILVPKEFLYGSYVVPVLEEMGREGMPKRMAGHSLGEACSSDGLAT